ncbi:ATP-grasp domain-containing protein [Streptomyces olivoreticuli]|uniref:ATP-grasp domain-containing protein n=1 Tax=Streptomyces olivoreticuli TaxID=68246 RepID=UPI000E2512C6|nr:ATP-grasp domain-containing protein [Streptomyces olivoreticuli]
MSERLLVCGIGAGMDRSLAALKDLGLDLAVITDRRTERVGRATGTVLVADPGDQRSVDRAVTAAGLRGVDGVLSLGYDNPPVISRLARRFGCPGVPEEVALDCTLKDRRLAVLGRAGLHLPRHRAADDLAGALAALAETGLPAVVKPRDLTGSAGVYKLDSPRTAPDRIREALRLSVSGRVVVEEFLAGTEHTVAGLVTAGTFHVTGFADREYGRKEEFAPYFFEGGDTMPTALSTEQADEVVAVVRAGVRALGLDEAVVNTDILRTRDGRVVLLELTCRLTGARIATEIMPLGGGIDPLPHAVRLALGRPVDLAEPAPRPGRAVVQRYLPCTGGTVEWVGDLREAAAPPEVHDVFWGRELRPGMTLPPYTGGSDPLAGVIATGDDTAQAAATAQEVLAGLPLKLSADTLDPPHTT